MTPLEAPRAVQEIARRLESAGFETWCVGGAVRDALLGHPNLDWDLATAATPKQLRALFRRTVPLGVEFGTVGILDDLDTMHEITTFRRDVQTDGRHAVVEFGASLDEDLARRDFTINAIALSPSTGAIHDPFGGRDDLARGIVRAVGDPATRMLEDRLRALRALRFAARFRFTIDPDTWRAIVASAPHLERLSRERVQQELTKTLEQVDQPSGAFRMWIESGAMGTLIPTLAPLSAETLKALDVGPSARVVLANALMGKGARREVRMIGRLTVLCSEITPREAKRVLRGLRFSNRVVSWVGAVLAGWNVIRTELEAGVAGAPVTDATIRRWVAATGRTRLRAVMRLQAALAYGRRGALPSRASAAGDSASAAGASEAEFPSSAVGEFSSSEGATEANEAARFRSLYRRSIRIAFRDPVELSDLAVDGDDLLAAGIVEWGDGKRGEGRRGGGVWRGGGRAVGWIVRELLAAVIEDPSRNTRDELLARARDLFELYKAGEPKE